VKVNTALLLTCLHCTLVAYAHLPCAHMPKSKKTKKGPKKASQRGGGQKSGPSQDITRHGNKGMTGPVRPKTARGGSAPHSAAAMAVCALTNPFCDGAIGARYLDATAHRSLPYTARFAFALATGSGGGGLIAIKVLADGVYTMAASGATDSPTTPATWTLSGGPPAGWDDSRITSWGVKASNNLSPNDSSGVVRVLSLNEPPLVSTAFNVTSYTYDTCETYPLSPGTTFHWIAKPANAPQTRRMLGPATNATTDTADAFMSGWQTVVIAAIGAKASSASVLYCEIVAHYEFTVGPASGFVPYQRPAPPPQPAITQAVDRLAQTSPQTQWNKTDSSVDEWFKASAKGALSMGMKAAGDWAMTDGLPAVMEGIGMLFA